MNTNRFQLRISKMFIALSATAVLAISSCKKREPEAPVEEELITTLKLTLNNGSNAPVTYTYKVQNGFNQTEPGTVQADTLRLAAGVSYRARLQVLNESVNPAEDVSGEIEEEKDDHLFLYVSNPAGGAGAVTFSAGSTDNQGRPFNMSGTLAAGTAGMGNLTIYLKHLPTDKNATSSAAAGPNTDAQAVFPVQIQ